MSSIKLFEPFDLRGLRLKNRIVVSPMGTYCSEEGNLIPFHFTHYGKFAMGGAALVMLEQTFVTKAGRVTNGDPGLWSEAQMETMAALVGHMKSFGARTGIQISSGGRKAGQQRAHHGNGALTDRDFAAGDEPLYPMGPSAIPLSDGWQTPRAMSVGEIEGMRNAFVAAVRRAVLAGFDVVEIHMAHGYLLQSFLSPLANQRGDAYGGTLENRMRFPLEVVRGARKVMPDAMPLMVRISATDWIEGGWTMEDSIVLSAALKAEGVDLIDCSSGGNMRTGATNSNLARGPGYQVPFAARIRREVGMPTAAVGMIRTPDYAERILQEGDADLIFVGRQMLFNPFWAHHAAQHFGLDAGFSDWPEQYGWWLEKWARSLSANGESPLGPENFTGFEERLGLG
ncbi:NADH:flavin oxidoreductase/NADH oxidase [Xanthobacter sediminis]